MYHNLYILLTLFSVSFLLFYFCFYDWYYSEHTCVHLLKDMYDSFSRNSNKNQSHRQWVTLLEVYQFRRPPHSAWYSCCSMCLQTLLSTFSMFANLVGTKWNYYTAAFNSISLNIHEIGHLFLCLLTFWLSSFLIHLFKYLAHFYVRLFVFFLPV